MSMYAGQMYDPNQMNAMNSQQFPQMQNPYNPNFNQPQQQGRFLSLLPSMVSPYRRVRL